MLVDIEMEKHQNEEIPEEEEEDSDENLLADEIEDDNNLESGEH
jgi:hypothetical protein